MKFGRLLFEPIVSLLASLLFILLGGLVIHKIGEGIIRKIQEGRRRFKSIFDHADVAIWNTDMSVVCTELYKLSQDGVVDLRQYLHDNEQLAWELVAKVSIFGINQDTLTLFGAESRIDFISRIDKPPLINSQAI